MTFLGEMVFCLGELKLFVDNVTTFPSFVIFNCQVKVNGPNAAPVYKFLKASKGGWFGSQIKWNFTKFLVDRDGIVIKRYATSTSPLATEGDVKKALGES
ncbi:probable phospholipid hydroperoxide glutathione peroxidase [Salvia hispanica]|uniref:probable phospholipid hydroperoxide glutathione peroxidase n=1 Tax=Salvia hispanica TaxID=49212 RepID=UPI0020092ADD|nr:probable phospholipid hydroperoxide glutathione peroxidase [Salvia hispanica]